ncbi:MAG: 5'-methylthioadenosine/adenosylhomocysteine nucleosidase [Marinifilaceae bacterium]|jgi:adenosylhomocysteine nucleosidase|nr:5'-methylthioadenosine/adenosylhomocysteine nucleosidase [Marinifilaceae bacterium]
MKIGIICAMESEIENIQKSLKNEKKHNIGKFEFIQGEIAGKELVILQSGIGKVNAAVGASVMFNEFKPDFLINSGAAGGFKSKLNIGDIVISENLIHHDVDCTVFGYKLGQIPQMPESFESDQKLRKIALDVLAQQDKLYFETGDIATGDQFMNDVQATKKLKENFPTVKAVEMEGAAIGQVAYIFEIPFLIIRSISDIAGQENAIEYTEFVKTASVNSAELVINMIAQL